MTACKKYPCCAQDLIITLSDSSVIRKVIQVDLKLLSDYDSFRKITRSKNERSSDEYQKITITAKTPTHTHLLITPPSVGHRVRCETHGSPEKAQNYPTDAQTSHKHTRLA